MSMVVSFLLRFEGAEADHGRLPLYDGAHSITGFARCVNLVAHSFANNEEIRQKGDNPKDVKTYIHPSTKGCFEEQIDVEFSEKLAQKIGPSVLSKNFWDYLIWSWSAAIGQDYTPVTPYVRKKESSDTPYSEDIGEALESAMIELHRVISSNPEVSISLVRLRGKEELVFNSESYKFVAKKTRSPRKIYKYGNVTKYNILSGNGRFFDEGEKRVISFKLIDHKDKENDEALAVRSMEERILGDKGKLRFYGYTISNVHGTVKLCLIERIELEDL